MSLSLGRHPGSEDLGMVAANMAKAQKKKENQARGEFLLEKQLPGGWFWREANSPFPK